MRHSSLWQLPVVLALLLLASCSAEMSLPDGPQVTPRTTHRRALPPQQVPQRLGSLWASLPHASATRAGKDPTPDSLFTVPTGDFVGTYEPGTDAWMQNPDIDQIDTLSTYGYVVTFKEQPGFVILSAVEGIPEVLFYAEKGQYNDGIADAQNSPTTGFHNFMDLMTAWVWYKLYAEENPDDYGPSDPDEHYDGDWEHEVVIAGNGIPTKWGQGYPYNMYCPKIDGWPTYTGCVATAAAQVMAYFRYPDSYAGKKFNWDEMIEVRWDQETYQLLGNENGFDNVAHLMRTLGIAGNLNMDYGVNASGTSCTYLYQTFHNFGYATGGTEDHFNYEKLKDEIDNGRPVIMRGRDKSDTGHAWVVDSYFNRWKTRHYADGRTKVIQKEEFVRCNWGWDGDKNGYAFANVFDPEETFLDPDQYMTKSVSATEYSKKTRMYTGFRPK